MSASQSISGLVSGLDTESIIEALMSYDTAKVTNLENKITELETKEACYESINELLEEFADIMTDLTDTELWNSYSCSSSDEDSLTATCDEYATLGSYTFTVLQLAQTAEYMSTGFSDKDETAVTDVEGVITIDSAESSCNSETELSELNGGTGVALGSIQITDKNGDTAVIDLSGAVTVQDVLDAINGCGLQIEASISTTVDGSDGSSLLITDTSGGTGTLSIKNSGGSTTASDLGIVGTDSSTSGYVLGDSVYTIKGSTALSNLHGGLGVDDGTLGSIQIEDGNGSVYTVDLSECTTLQGVINAIEDQTSDAISVRIADDGASLLIETSDGTGSLTITSVTSGDETNTTAEDLGIAVTAGGSSVQGERLIAAMNSVQIASLSGVDGGGINGARGDYSQTLSSFTADVDGTTVTFDLSSLTGSDSLSDAIALMNEQAESQLGEGVLVFSLNSAENGIQVENASGSIVTFTDTDGTTAADLGLTDTEFSNNETTNCGDLDHNYLSRATKLEDMNGTEGITEGSIYITDTTGDSTTIDLSDCETLGDVIDLINESGLELTAQINAAGDGIELIEDTGCTGTGTISVAEVDSGSTASELGILGNSTENDDGLQVLDGSFETTIEIDTNDTLTDIMNKLSSATDLTVSIINDGSDSPYRLVITGTDSGEAYDIIVDSDLDIFNFTQTTDGQDSVLLYGSSDSSVTMKSSTNTNSNAMLGVTLYLTEVTGEEVTITISQDTDTIVEKLEEFTEAYNNLLELINELDQYVSEEDQEDEDEDSVAGLLYADSATRSMLQSITDALFTTRSDCGDITSLYDIGFSWDDDYILVLDTDTLEELISTDFDNLQKFLSNKEDVADSSSGATVSASAAGNGTDAQNLINGDTSSGNFGEDNGYEAAGTISDGYDTVTINFDDPVLLDYMTIYHIDSDDMAAEDYAISDFVVEYLDSTGTWQTLREVTDNTSSKTVIGLADTTEVYAIRITATETNADDDIMRLVEVNCYSYTGVLDEMCYLTDNLTDDEDGYYAVLTESIDDQIETLEDQIEQQEEKNESKEELLWTKYTAMETTLASLESEASYLESVMDSLDS